MLKFWAPAMGTESVVEGARVRCPNCQSVEGIPVCNLKSYSISRDGEVLEQQIGYRVACQRCPTVYSIGPSGVFRHHRQSQPPDLYIAPPAVQQADGEPEPPPQDIRERSTPRRRPANP